MERQSVNRGFSHDGVEFFPICRISDMSSSNSDLTPGITSISIHSRLWTINERTRNTIWIRNRRTTRQMGSVFWGSLSPRNQTYATIRSWPVDLLPHSSSMPDIPVGAQIFDVVFHPTFSTVYTGLLTGYVKAFSYDDQGNHKPAFSVRPSKSSCRGLSLDQDGSHLYAVGKGKSLKYVIQSPWLWPNP